MWHLLRQHLTNAWRLSLSPSSPHLPQGYQDQRMVTCPHPLLDLSCQGIVLLVRSLTSDDRWLPAQYFSDTQELDPLKLDTRGRQVAKASSQALTQSSLFSCSLLKTSVDSSVSLVAFNFYYCQQTCRKLKLSCKKKACTYLNIYIYKWSLLHSYSYCISSNRFFQQIYNSQEQLQGPPNHQANKGFS